MFTKLLDSILLTAEKEELDFNSPETVRFMNALTNAVIRNKPIPMNYYFKDNKPLIALWSKKLVELGLLNTRTDPKYCSATIDLNGLSKSITKGDIDSARAIVLLNRFSLTKSVPSKTLLTKSGHDYFESGLNRPGFKKRSATEFKLDTVMLRQYLFEIEDELKAGLIKAQSQSKDPWDRYNKDDFNYSELIRMVLRKYTALDETYNLEDVYADGRGRAIFVALRKLLNPVGSKLGRALVVIPDKDARIVRHSHTDAMNDIYLFIAELVGGRSGITAEVKAMRGKIHAIKHTEVDDLADNIWLQRIYKLLDTMRDNGKVLWNVPLEVDASMLTK